MGREENRSGFGAEPISKPLDRPFPDYRNDESVPRDDFGSMPLDSELENPGDLSKRFA